MQNSASPSYSVSTDRAFLWRLCIAAWLLRLVIVIGFALTDAIRVYTLSPDHWQYAKEAYRVMAAMDYGDFALKSWVDDGWFQFAGLLYYLFVPSPFVVQLVNITLSVLTVIPLFFMARQLTDDVRVQRFYAVMVAFFPSLIFWSTLMLKDAAAIFALALVIYGVFTLRLRFSLWPFLGVIAGLMIFIGTRTYLFMVIIMVMPAAFLLFPYRRAVIPWRAILIPAVIGALPMIIGYGYFASGEFQRSIYFDVDYINRIRVSMGSQGAGAMFGSEVHQWGNGVFGDIWAALTTVLAVFIPINPLDVGSVRQFIALPLVVVMYFLAVPMVTGGLQLWRMRRLTAPIFVISSVVLAVYVGGTSNSGALFRWTSQIMPYFLLAVAMGVFRRESTRLARIASGVALAFSQPRRLAAAY